ncbi:hypothetical protein PBI_SCTP2_414 [Salicola phage SCTP-2]|nr:hypothetical protein PBI_SCTP2_414 [Salicola phage SCTP-2]
MNWKLRNLIKSCNSDQTEINGQWVPARPMRVKRFNIKGAWDVLRGKADAVYWPGGQ